jgi:SAM-dependent methyltransferase
VSDAGFWDQRYGVPEYQFGTAPNAWLAAQAGRLGPGMRALAAGDGEGRNGVWLARQGLEVTSVDLSAVGLAKARALAAAEGVPLRTMVANLAEWGWPEAAFDLIAWIYVIMPEAERRAAAAKAVRALAPGGLLVLEGFTPRQLGRASGGPKDPALLWTRAMVEADFAGLEVVEIWEGLVALEEGPRHRGMAEVVRGVLRKA